jgi:hypothetical protein
MFAAVLTVDAVAAAALLRAFAEIVLWNSIRSGIF